MKRKANNDVKKPTSKKMKSNSPKKVTNTDTIPQTVKQYQTRKATSPKSVQTKSDMNAKVDSKINPLIAKYTKANTVSSSNTNTNVPRIDSQRS